MGGRIAQPQADVSLDEVRPKHRDQPPIRGQGALILKLCLGFTYRKLFAVIYKHLRLLPLLASALPLQQDLHFEACSLPASHASRSYF